jgi:mannose-6-phosphate isomerase-like protein (cupin superfamily)
VIGPLAAFYFGLPGGARHRLKNLGKVDLELIEVQIGSYLGEDDIVRIEDDYRRS